MATDNFSREELQDIRSRAEFMADGPGGTKQHMIAYLELASAADRLDAMIARSQSDQSRRSTGGWPSGPVPVPEEDE